MALFRHAWWRPGIVRPFVLATASASILMSCQSSDLQEGMQPPTEASAIVIEGLTLSPTSATLAPGQSITFTPLGWLHTGPPPITASVTWTATGGTISSSGVYRAGSTPGTYYVKAKSTTSWNEEVAPITIKASTSTATISQLIVTPGSVTIAPGKSQQFTASAKLSDGTTQANPAGLTWSGTGGTMTQSGLYTAGQSQGTFRIIAMSSNGKRDTSAVVVSTSATTTVTAINISPASASVTTGGTKQFTASATLSNGSTGSTAVTWSATGGTISSAGLYTAGGSAGSFKVIAKQTSGTHADTVPVSVTTSTSTPPPSGSPGFPNRPSGYTRTSQIDFSQPVPAAPDNVDRPISGATGWYMIYFGNSWSQRSDGGAPQSAPGIWNGNWPAGSYGGGVLGQGSGHGIGNIFTYDPKGSNHVYFSTRVYFDQDASQWHPISNKFINIETDAGLLLVQLMEGGFWRHAEELTNSGRNWWIDRDNSPGMVDNRSVPTRQWVNIEVLIDLPNRVFKIWQDGVLTTNATPSFSATRITNVAVNAFRGGGGETLSAPINWRYDHFLVAW